MHCTPRAPWLFLQHAPSCPGTLYLLLSVPGMFLPLIPTSDFSSSLRSRFGCHLCREQHHNPPPFTLFPLTLPYFSKVLLNLNMACGSESPHLSYIQGPLSIRGLRALEMGPGQVGMWLCQIHSRFLWLDTPKQWKTALQYFSLFFFFATLHSMWNFPGQGQNPWPLQWKCGVSTTRPPRQVHF